MGYLDLFRLRYRQTLFRRVSVSEEVSMRKILPVLTCLFAIMLVACAGAAEPTPAPPPVPAATEAPAGPPDSGSMPQLIEFYADW